MPGQTSRFTLRQDITEYLKFSVPVTAAAFETHEDVAEEGYRRLRVSYLSEEGDSIPAYLLLPDQAAGGETLGAVLVHHQHHGQRHLGKSEVCGLVGDPLQAFGPALARQGLVVLAPDSICFEDRRKNRTGTEADEEADVDQHYNELCYRILRGDTLMRKVLSDSAQAISILRAMRQVAPDRIAILGHSYGGNTVLFHAALDERIRLACASGAAGTYHYKMAHQAGIEMAEVIPGFINLFDIPDLLACFAPRPVLIVSAAEDMASQDALEIVARAEAICASVGLPASIEHKRYAGTHALTQERFEDILRWLVQRLKAVP